MPKSRTQRVKPNQEIDDSQAWFWTEEWQAGERKVDEYIREGDVQTFDSAEEFVEELHRVKMVSLIDARLKVTGKYSGQEYLFPQAGAVQDVDQRDVEWLLSKRQGERQCCGGTERNKVFQLA